MVSFPESTLQAIAQRATHHLVGLLREGLHHRPEDVDLLTELGVLLTTAGQYQEGLEIDQRLVRLCPEDPIVHYNLGCSLALLGRVDEAFRALEAALDLGYEDLHLLHTDPDMANVRKDPRFGAFLERWTPRR